ncbi:MAG: transcriptional repressor [Clostridiaceae bacterium]|nr:transcriptional repressor [Clostridiaceae bacterium]
MDRNSISNQLIKNNIKPSYARIKIMEYLIQQKNHPNVDEIYTELVKDIPTLSKTTVYNTLNLFNEAGLIKVITIEENEARFDADTSEHGHFKCENCNKIYDFFVKLEGIEISGLENFKIRQKDIFFKGICAKCINYINNN